MGDRLGIHGAVDTFVCLFLTDCWFHVYIYVGGVFFLIQQKTWWEKKNMFLSDDARRELVPISPDRWPAAVGTELAEVSVFLTVQGSKTVPHLVWGPRQVGLRPEGPKPGLRRSSLTSSEGVIWKCIPDCSLPWSAFGQSGNLSKTTKLILLDSLLQEVCIKTSSAGRSPLSSLRLSVCLVQSQTFFIQD